MSLREGLSTKEGPTASSIDVPSDKDELNSVLPHVGKLGLDAMLQKHRIPSGRTMGIGTPCLVHPVAQEGLAAKEGQPHKEATYGTFPRARPSRRRGYSRVGKKAKKEGIVTKE
jgi:hypothetical protein